LYDTCAQFRAENVCLQKHITDYSQEAIHCRHRRALHQTNIDTVNFLKVDQKKKVIQKALWGRDSA